MDDHARLDFARARRDQRSRVLQFDDAYPADVDGRQVFEITERRGVDAEFAPSFEQRGAFGYRNGLPIDRDFDLRLRLPGRDHGDGPARYRDL